MNKMRLQIS